MAAIIFSCEMAIADKLRYGSPNFIFVKYTFLITILVHSACLFSTSPKASCRDPLGMENGIIKDNQITVFSAYNDDFNTYGAQRARLNLKTWPQGHRAKPDKASSTWLKIELKENMIITGIATQGYGDPSVGEWVKQYMLLYSTGKDYLYFKDQSGGLKMFAGNTDWHSIKRNEVPIPTVVKSIMLMPTDYHTNFALRMELYGCKPGYYFIVSLMILDTYFTTIFLNSNETMYKTMKEDTEMEVGYALEGVAGYLGAKLERFSPEKSQYSELNLMAEVRINCIEASVHFLTTKLQSSIQQTEGLFQSSSMKVKYPLDFSCRPPSVKVNLSKTEAEASIVHLTDPITLKGEVELRCNATSETLYAWELAHVRMENKQLISPVTFGMGLIQVTEKARKWGVGLKYVRFSASMIGQEGTTSYDYGFINVTLPPLVANIKGPKEVVKGTGPFVLDARDSLDPSDPFTKYKGITFIWLCRRSGESFTGVNMSHPFDVISVTRKRNKGGCFGYGPGKMNETGPLLHVEPAFMASKNVYVFQVIITKDNRQTKLEHQMRVNSSLSLSLRCLINCGHKVSTNLRMTVEAVCKGLTCKAIQSHNWVLYTNIASHNVTVPKWQKVDDLEEKSLTDLDSHSIVIKGRLNENFNALENDAEYKLVGEVLLKDGSVERDQMTFITNSPPQGGYCMADPEIGTAVTTEFYVQCDEFKDDDLPLQFEFRYHTNTGMIVIEKTFSNHIITRLPLGDPVADYIVPIEVLVSDSFGGSSMDFTFVFVKPMITKDVSGTLKSMTSGKNSAMGNLLKSGDVSKATQMAYAVLSLVDKSEGNIEATDRKSLKDGIIDQISKVKVKNLEQVTQVAAVVALATGQKDEISQKSQENAVGLLEDTALFMANQKNDNPELLQKVGASLLHGIGNILSAASNEAKETANEKEKRGNRHKPDKESEETKKKGKEMSEKTLQLMEVVGGSLLSTKTVGEKPSVFKTKNMALLLDRQMASKMGNKKLGEGDSEVALPSADTLFGNNSDNMAAIDSQMMAFDENPFTWDSSSKNVRSSVVEFKFKTSHGKVLDITGLSKPIELYIPQKLQEEPQNVNNSSNEYFVKPSKNKKNIRSHQITIPSHDAAVSVTIKPQDGINLVVYVRHLLKPTPDSYDLKKIMPDYTSCLNYDVEMGYQNCTDDPYTLTISSASTGEIGIHYIGVQYTPVQSMDPVNPSDGEVISARLRRDCYSHSGRVKRGCIGVKDPPTTPAPTPLIIVPLYNGSTDVNYTMSVSVTSCLYWSEKQSKWTSEGCKVGPKSNARKLHCLCTHLSAFGGDFFVAPNPIDFDKVFAEFGRLGETGNFVVLATVCGLFGLYFIGLVFARKADKRDDTKVIANVYLREKDMQEGYIYQISVQTGMWRGYGTTANVGIRIYGEEGKSDDILLTDKSLNKTFFSRGSVNNFTIALPVSVGELLKIKLWHDNSGPSPAWFFQQVLITDAQTGEQWHFLGNRWLAVEKGDGQIEVEILKADKKQLSGFKNLFHSRTARSLGEGHLWLSIFTRPPHNTFTRCQRLSCCLSILFAAMVTNAMFYQFGTEPKDTFNIGPLKMSWTQIKIGIQSSIVAIPVNILIVTIFRNIKQNVPDNDNHREDGNSNSKKKKTPGCLPHFFIYIGWTLCILTSLAAATFTVFYSLMWGANTSNQWLTSIMVSFFQDVIITQPIKVIAIASLLSLVLKKPPENDVVLGESLKNEKENGNRKGCVAPRGEELEKQREYQKKVIEMFRTLVEIIFFMIFLLLVTVVCYGNRSVSRYHMTEGMEKLCSGFEKALTTDKFWNWTKNKLLPALYDTDWYNGEPFTSEEGFVSNREMFIVGMPRLRQLRMRPERHCSIEKKEPRISHQFKRCIPKYSHEHEDKTEFNMPGWNPVYNVNATMSLFELWDLCPKPWRYRTARSLNSLPFQGAEVSYDGGGFVADLGYDVGQAMDVINNLEYHKWIDDKTAAVIVEITVFDPATLLFSHVKYLYERFTTGGTNVRTTIKTLVLYSSSDQTFQSFYQVCQLMLMLMILFFFFVEIGKVYRQGRAYVRQFWNWMELVQIISAVSAIVMFFFKEKYTSDFVRKVQNNPYETSSIDYIILWSDLEIYLLSLVIFIVTIKFLRLIRFNRSICQMTGTLVRSAKNIWSFFIIFVAILLGFTQLGFLAFGATVTAYSSFFQSLRSVMQMLLGGEMHFYELQSTNGIIGPIFTFVFMFSMTMILLNMFLAILNESYEETREDENSDDFADADLCDFMFSYFGSKYKLFLEEYKNVQTKILSIAERFIRQRRKRKEEEYHRLHAEEVKETDVCEDESNRKKSGLVFLASIESFHDLLSDENLDDIKSNITDLKQSLTSLHSLEGNKLLPLPKEYESQAYASPKWDSPEVEISPVTSSQQTSIFDRPPPYERSIFDRPLEPVTSIFDRPNHSYFSGRYSPFSSSRALNYQGVRQSKYLLMDEDEDGSTANENSRLLTPKYPTVDTTTTSIAGSDGNE
ncbi:uncharacterized protein LOC116305596 isoform X3 [Actinia tenebrosa]|uniref:Uncharacterized protein LOC116305596 isoform X3 n=1 Tax=Actinia tenebrosa TaxID=6105 RepID=A0A6P8IVS7_ACTTE|nr:uncharacterized protein LOC116305596 isoform X3 [Actinia tenebrosa]